MSGRIEKIIKRVRATLADEDLDTPKFSQDRLIDLLDEGQKALVLSAELLRTRKGMPLIAGQAEYTTPDDCYKLMRVLADGIPVGFISHSRLDQEADKGSVAVGSQGWESVSGPVVKYIVYDKLNLDKFKVYPIPESPLGGISTVKESDESVPTSYGLLTKMDGYEISDIYGVVSGLSDDKDNIYVNVDPDESPLYGLMVTLQDQSVDLTLYYLKKPAELVYDVNVPISEMPDPEVDETWDTALKFYVTGMAYKDDKDTQNRAIGNDELILFSTYVATAKKAASADFIRASGKHNNVVYNNGFNE